MKLHGDNEARQKSFFLFMIQMMHVGTYVQAINVFSSFKYGSTFFLVKYVVASQIGGVRLEPSCPMPRAN